MNEREPMEERLAERVGEAYRKLPPIDAAARERLDQALARLPAPRRRASLRAWLTRPLALSVQPVMGALALILLLAVGVLLGRGVVPHPGVRNAPEVGGPEGPAGSSSETGVVQFVFVAPQASRVALVGDFNGWDPAATPMARPAGSGSWTVRMTLPPGRHVYAFVMDGTRWVNDPQAPLAPANEFGFRNSILLVGESETS